MTSGPEGDVSWWSRQSELTKIPYSRRSINRDFYTPDIRSKLQDVLIFKGTAPRNHNIPLPNASQWDGPELNAEVYIHREEHEAALKRLRDLAFITERADAYNSERSKPWAALWDTQLWFESCEDGSWRVLASTYAAPDLFDRLLTMPLKQCTLSLKLNTGVLSPNSELAKPGPHNASKLGRLPTPTKDVDGGPTIRTNTAAQLMSLTVSE